MAEKEDSIVFKILGDPNSPKFMCAILSLKQLLIYGGTNESPTFTVLVNILTFLASCLTIGLVVGKKAESFANFCLFKCVTQKKEIDWNGFYYTYTIVFFEFNLLAIARFNSWEDQGFAWIFGIIVTVVYFVDGLHAFNKIETIHIDEPSTPCCYARFLKLVGSFPKIIRLLILILNVVLIVLLANRIGCYVNYSSFPYYDCDNDKDVSMMIFIAIILIAVSVLNIILCYDILYWHHTFNLTTTIFSMYSFFVCLNNFDCRIPMTIITFVIFLLALFMTIAESYVKSNVPIESSIMESNNRTILPKNLAKNIMNPIVPDGLKIKVIQEIDPTELIHDSRPLLQ
uniref:Uncharacterized protein n=1 Tax=Acrobeloides nanus TaxID=290746 RepID=A0A914DJ34_9BILA